MEVLINAIKTTPDYDLNNFKSLLYENKLSADDINTLIWQNFKQNSIYSINNVHDTIKISDILIQYTKDMTIDEYMTSYDEILIRCIYNDINKIYLLEYYIKHINDINSGLLKFSLLAAVQKNYLSAVNILLQAGIDVNVYDNDGCTALMYAAQISSYDIIKALLDSNVDINYKNFKGDTAVMYIKVRSVYAPIVNHSALIALFIQYGADINIPNNDNLTLLDYYITNPHVLTHIKPHLSKTTIINTFKYFVNKQVVNHLLMLINKLGPPDDHDSHFYSLQYILDQCSNTEDIRLFYRTIKQLVRANTYCDFLYNSPAIKTLHYSKLLYQAISNNISKYLNYTFFIKLLLNTHVPLTYRDDEGRNAYDLLMGIGTGSHFEGFITDDGTETITYESYTNNHIIIEAFNNYINNKTLQFSCYLLSFVNEIPLTNIHQCIIANIIEVNS